MSDTQQTPNNDQTKAEAPPLASLSEINALCRERRKATFTLAGKQCTLEVVPLTPQQMAKVRDIEDSVQPSVVRGKTPEDDRLDDKSAAYVKSKLDALTKARAVGLYWGVPAFNQANPGLTDPNAISAFVQDQLTEGALSALWAAILIAGGAKEAELVNFT